MEYKEVLVKEPLLLNLRKAQKLFKEVDEMKTDFPDDKYYFEKILGEIEYLVSACKRKLFEDI